MTTSPANWNPHPEPLSILRERALQKIVGSVERARVLVIADHESPHRLDRRLGARNRRRVEGSRDGNQEAGSHLANSTARGWGRFAGLTRHARLGPAVTDCA